MEKLIRNDIARLIYKKIHSEDKESSDDVLQNKEDDQMHITEQDTLLSLSEQDINILIKLCTQVISDALIEKNRIELRYFGVFELRERKAKQKARNPKTGESVKVPKHNVVAFRSGKHLRNAVWHLNDD